MSDDNKNKSTSGDHDGVRSLRKNQTTRNINLKGEVAELGNHVFITWSIQSADYYTRSHKAIADYVGKLHGCDAEYLMSQGEAQGRPRLITVHHFLSLWGVIEAQAHSITWVIEPHKPHSIRGSLNHRHIQPLAWLIEFHHFSRESHQGQLVEVDSFGSKPPMV